MAEMIHKMFPPFPTPGFAPNFTGYEFDNMNASWYELYDYMAQPPWDMMSLCQYNAAFCDYEALDRIPTNMGFCVSFNPASANYTSRQAGATGGVLMMLHVNQAEYLYSASSSAGFRVLLHEPDEIPLMLERGFKVSPGFLTQVSVTVNQVIELAQPYGDCEPSGSYRQSNCLAECKANYVIRNCSCKDINMPGDAPVCDPKVKYECLSERLRDYVRDSEATKCNCPRQCHRLVYDYRVSQARLSNFAAAFAKAAYQFDLSVDEVIADYGSLEVFFSELKYTYITSEPAYTVLAMMCDIGGALGLILGSTMLTFCEFVDVIVTLVATWLKARASVDVIDVKQ